jgi:hypothetical protein
VVEDALEQVCPRSTVGAVVLLAVVLLVVCLWIFVMLQFGQTLMPFALKRAAEGRPT